VPSDGAADRRRAFRSGQRPEARPEDRPRYRRRRRHLLAADSAGAVSSVAVDPTPLGRSARCL